MDEDLLVVELLDAIRHRRDILYMPMPLGLFTHVFTFSLTHLLTDLFAYLLDCSTIRYDTIGEFNVDSKAEYTA